MFIMMNCLDTAQSLIFLEIYTTKNKTNPKLWPNTQGYITIVYESITNYQISKLLSVLYYCVWR